jgi:2-haloacid dehalogenase
VQRPAWVAFDLNGTLLDPAALLGDEHAETGRAALDDAVLQAMADTITGEHRPFPDYLRAALERRLRIAGADGDTLDAAIDRARRLPAFPDARPALETLAAAGYRIAVLTNSAADAAGAALDAAGLAARVDVVIGADEIGAYKPDLRVYRHAARRLGASADRLCLVTAHGWDVLGARRADWAAAWGAHREQYLLSTVPEPSLRGVARRSGASAQRAVSIMVDQACEPFRPPGAVPPARAASCSSRQPLTGLWPAASTPGPKGCAAAR